MSFIRVTIACTSFSRLLSAMLGFQIKQGVACSDHLFPLDRVGHAINDDAHFVFDRSDLAGIAREAGVKCLDPASVDIYRFRAEREMAPRTDRDADRDGEHRLDAKAACRVVEVLI